jgi:riboflavin kinase, archaea type
MILQGVVESGIGNFGTWIALLQDHYERKTGMLLFPGTLNIRLKQAFELPEDCCRLEAEDYEGTVSVNIVPCTILGRKAVILRTDKNDSGEGDHPRELVEIATDIGLRARYGLRDGDFVSITVGE